MEQAIVSGVTHDTSEAKLTIAEVPDRPGIAARLFRALADEAVNVDMIVQNVSSGGATDISFTVPKADLAAAIRVTQSLAPEIGAKAVTPDAEIARVEGHEQRPAPLAVCILWTDDIGGVTEVAQVEHCTDANAAGRRKRRDE